MAFSAGGNSGNGVNMTNCALAKLYMVQNMGYNSNYATSNATYETLSGKLKIKHILEYIQNMDIKETQHVL